MAAQAFREMDCQVHIEKRISIARGKVNVDVYVIDHSQTPILRYICECKYWSSKVPKTVVHSFRSVISDSGVHLGIIISRQGFQSGAYDSAINSNIKLYSWHEFVREYESRWTKSIIKHLDEQSNAIQRYLLDPSKNTVRFPPKNQQSDQFVHSWVKIFNRAVSVRAICHNISNSIEQDDFPTKFPDPDFPDSYEWIVIHSKREGYEYVLPRLLSCRQELERLAGKLK